MIRLVRKITFRLTHEEETKYLQLSKDLHLWDWSHTIRTALKQMFEKHQAETSDNGVRQKQPSLSDILADAKHKPGCKLAPKKKRGGTRKKSTV